MLNRRLITRGEVYYIDLSQTVGSEQSGLRPCLVISNDVNNKHSPCVTVIPFTSSTTKANIPTHISVSANECGLRQSSIALCEQIRTIDKRRIKNRVGVLTAEKMMLIDIAIKMSLGVE